MLSRITTLQWAFLASLAVHGGLLTLRLANPEAFERLVRDTPLQVILVNTQTDATPPAQAQALAQAHLAGGGEATSGRVQSPLLASARNQTGEADEGHFQQQIAQMQKQQSQLLAQIKATLANLPMMQADPESDAAQRQRKQLLQLLAEIEQRIQEQNAKPRKRYLSPATREVVYARYYDGMRRQIENWGTRYFPEKDGQKLYGVLTMVITVNAQGKVLATEVAQSSGSLDLDRRAQAIANRAGPFGVFSAEMRQHMDQLALVTRFHFTREGTLDTQWSEP